MLVQNTSQSTATSTIIMYSSCVVEAGVPGHRQHLQCQVQPSGLWIMVSVQLLWLHFQLQSHHDKGDTYCTYLGRYILLQVYLCRRNWTYKFHMHIPLYFFFAFLRLVCFAQKGKGEKNFFSPFSKHSYRGILHILKSQIGSQSTGVGLGLRSSLTLANTNQPNKPRLTQKRSRSVLARIGENHIPPSSVHNNNSTDLSKGSGERNETRAQCLGSQLYLSKSQLARDGVLLNFLCFKGPRRRAGGGRGLELSGDFRSPELPFWVHPLENRDREKRWHRELAYIWHYQQVISR